MSHPRVLGTETEFGIATKDPEAVDPVSNSLLLINNYPALPSARVLWDYENENPLLDLRGFEVEGERERPGPEYNKLLNKLLANGGRLYVDGAHPEYSTPECTNARDVVMFEKAGERILDLCRQLANRAKEEEKFFIYKNNTDGKGNSYGYHENYLMPRALSFDRIMQPLIPFLVTRQIYAGAGKVGAENRMPPIPYQLSQRADFFESLIDLNTMVKRPIINTRDEPHADPAKYRRLHIIIGDANMSEFTTYLKVGTMAIVLSMIADAHEVKGIELEDPVKTMKEVSRDPQLKQTIRLTDGRTITAIEIQRIYLEHAHRYLQERPPDPIAQDVLVKWGAVLDQLAKDPMQLSREIDWVIKKELIESYMAKKGCGWEDSRVSMMDLQYHDVNLQKGLYYALERGGYVERIVSYDEIAKAETMPPLDTRAYFRAMCLKKYPKEVYAASWSSVLFDIGNTTIKRVPLMEPLRGTENLTKGLLEESNSVEELLARIKA